MTIDEAIEYYIKAATQRAIADEEKGDYDKWNETRFITKKQSTQIIADDRQLAEWLEELRARRLLMDKVCEELARLYGSPCQNPKAEDFIRENGSCNDCKISITDKECWFRYFHRKFNCRWCKADEALWVCRNCAIL